MVAAACISCRGRTSRSRWIVRVIDVLVVAVDNRGKAIGARSRVPVHRYSEIVIQIAVTSTGDSTLADTAKVNYRSCPDLREAAAGRSRAQVLRHVYIPGSTIRIAVGRSTCFVTTF